MLLVIAGSFDQESGGEIFSPKQVYFKGICPPARKTGLCRIIYGKLAASTRLRPHNIIRLNRNGFILAIVQYHIIT
jgi:hypothetical protein